MMYFCFQLKKSRSDADDRRRKSLLPWSRSRSRCKSRDRSISVAGSSEQDKDTVSTGSSRWSLASWDLALSSTLCRVVLPDDATAVVQIKPDQTIRQMVTKLLEKRALNYNCFQVFVGQSTKVRVNDSIIIYCSHSPTMIISPTKCR